MRHHFELAQGSRRSAASGVQFEALFIDGCEKLGETEPTKLLGVDGCTKLNRSQFLRLSRELGECFPDLRGSQVQLLKDLCLVANCSEEFFLSVSKDQWLRTAIICNKHPNALFSSEVIEQQCHTIISSITIHSNVVPWHPYWPKLQAVRDEAPEVASKRVYFPSTILEVALSEDKSLVEKLNEWEEKDKECTIAKQWHERYDDAEKTSRPFWKIGPDDVEAVNRNFVEGGQADVWKILWRGGIFARKVFKHKDIFDTELEVVRRVSHPHIVYSFGVSMSPDKQQHSLLMELLDRDLFLLIEDIARVKGRSKPPFSRPDSLDILLQVAKAMAHMHHGLDEPVIHGDLKPQNILVSHCEILGDVCQYFVKVADFGSAKILKSNSSSTFNPDAGTTPYAAPEVLKALCEKTSINHDPKKIDVYSFGILAFQVLTGLEPYKNMKNSKGVPVLVAYKGVRSRGDLKKGVMAGTLRPPLHEACSRPNFWNDSDLIALVKRCWDPEPSARPFFLEVIDQLESIYSNLNQQTNGSKVHPRPQMNAVTAPQSNSTRRNGPPRPEVNQVTDASSAAQVLSRSDQEMPKKASRRRVFIRRHLLSWTCISPGKTIE